MKNNELSKEYFIQKYQVENRSILAISKELGRSTDYVRIRLVRYEISINSKRRGCQEKYKIDEAFLREKYFVDGLSMRKIAKLAGCSKTTIEEKFKKFGIERYNSSYYMTKNNPMKRPEVREKVSKWRKNMPQETRDVYAASSRKSWADGKHDGTAVGRCKWYDFIKKDGITVKCQGTWELAFAEWLDENNLNFKAHRGWISYSFNDENHLYYPDFWVDEWGCYVDVKCRHFYDLQKQKFDAILKSNPDLKIKILLKEDLLNLGVKL